MFLERPEVVANVATFVILSWAERGWRRTAAWLVTGTCIGWLMEFSSVRTGFPFGAYVYREANFPDEAWISGVPLFASLSFAALSYFGHSAACTMLSPLRWQRWGAQRIDSPAITGSLSVLSSGEGADRAMSDAPRAGFVRGMATLAAALCTLGRSYRRFEWKTGEDERHAARTPDGWNLALYRYRAVGAARSVPITCSHGMAGSHFIFDLHPDYSLARFLARQGFDTWLVDLRGRGDSWPAGGPNPTLQWSFDRSRDGSVVYSERLSEVRLPLLVIAAARDLQRPSEAVRTAFDGFGSSDKTFLRAGVADGFSVDFGHDDLLAGLAAPAEVFPRTADWLIARSESS